MSKINLRDLYPDFYSSDCIIEVQDKVLSVFVEYEHREAAYARKMYRYKAQYSLDRADGIENAIQFVSYSPDEIYEHNLTTQQLYAAIATLPDKQAKRIYEHYILGIGKTEIAKAEGASTASVVVSIERGLRNMKTFFEKVLLTALTIFPFLSWLLRGAFPPQGTLTTSYQRAGNLTMQSPCGGCAIISL